MNTNGKLNIELKSLVLKNFKGIKDLTISFNHVTNIAGDNATGKTTVNDAFRWLLFDKDSTDRKNFEIKTLDKFNRVISGLEHSVTGTLLVNGKEKSFQKIFKEKWQKKRGEADAQFTGHETLYYINEVPVKQSDYQNEVYSIIDETLFKLITDPLYFSSTMKWQERRNLLFNMFDHISVDDILAADKSLLPLKEELAEHSIEDLKKKYSSQKKKLNDDIKAIPFRIDECNNSIKDIDVTNLIQKLNWREKRIEEIESELLTSNLNDNGELKVKLQKIRADIYSIEQEHENKISEQKREINNNILILQNDIKGIYRELDFAQSRSKVIAKDIELYGNQVDLFLNQWHEEKDKEFMVIIDGSCPTCKRPLDPETLQTKKQDLLKNFNQDKANKLTSINNKGKDAREKLDATNKELEENEEFIAGKNKELEKLNFQLEKVEKEKSAFELSLQKTLTKEFDYGRRYFELKDECETIEKQLTVPDDTRAKLSKLSEERKTLLQEIETIKTDLHQGETNKKQKARIAELEEQERRLAQQIADIEKMEFLCEKYIKTEVELLESSINKKFKYVRFKLFETQINGGLVETCEPLIAGIPFADANNAGRINAGIDIINALSEYHKVSAPIIIDNREAINEIIPTSAQVVNLVVTKDKKLVVN